MTTFRHFIENGTYDGDDTDMLLLKSRKFLKQNYRLTHPIMDFYISNYLKLATKEDLLKENWDDVVAKVHQAWKAKAPATKAVDADGTARILFHGGNNPGTYVIKTDPTYRIGLWATSRVDVAVNYGKPNALFFVMNKPFVVDGKGAHYASIPTPKEMRGKFTQMEDVDTDLCAEYALQNKYDGVIIKNILEGNGAGWHSDVYVTFNKANVVPLG